MTTNVVTMTFKRRHIGVVMALVLMALTLFMALAAPFTLFRRKQSETTELKSVIIVGRHGEVSPTSGAYFMGEHPPDELQLVGEDQLTNTGKERMFLLGKFLKLLYYDRLLKGNPRKVSITSADSDKCLESAQSLLAGLNPPQDNWIWSSQLTNWQPKAIHTTESTSDDLLSSESSCLRQDYYQDAWKNSSKYLQLLNEFRHELQLMRQNTGLEFEDDLEILTNIEEALKVRKKFDNNNVPSWYTDPFASRLSHIANMATVIRYEAPEMQQLIVGRLLHEIIENVFDKIRTDLTASGATIVGLDNLKGNKQSAYKIQASKDHATEPNMFIYMTDKQHLSALLNSLRISSNQSDFGSLLIIELHYDPIKQVHFLRLFTVDSPSHNVIPEPVRVKNSVACQDSADCSPQQLGRSIRHLAIRKQAWQQLCLERTSPGFEMPTTTTHRTDLIHDGNSIAQSTDSAATTQLDLVTIQPEVSTKTPENLDELDEKLIVGPMSVTPMSGVVDGAKSNQPTGSLGESVPTSNPSSAGDDARITKTTSSAVQSTEATTTTTTLATSTGADTNITKQTGRAETTVPTEALNNEELDVSGIVPAANYIPNMFDTSVELLAGSEPINNGHWRRQHTRDIYYTEN